VFRRLLVRERRERDGAGASARAAHASLRMWLHSRGSHAAGAHKSLRAYALANSRAWTNRLPAPQPVARYASLGARIPVAAEPARPGEQPVWDDAASAAPAAHPYPAALHRANPCLAGPLADDAEPPKGDAPWDFTARA
jgi:hypothetical protein